MDTPTRHNKNNKTKPNAFKLDIPLDASKIEGFKPEQKIKVLAIGPDNKTLGSQLVKLSDKGSGLTSFTFPKKPKTLRILVGPETAEDDELEGLQTIRLNVSSRQWVGLRELKLPPLHISAFYWFWWLRWCRNFTIRGRVVCPSGLPVPGAKVCAYDVDAWWWWSSKQLVGCATTDATGTFEINFKWCCGWRPWWWWRYHIWSLEPILAERIIPTLQNVAHLPIPIPEPVPDANVFKQLLGEDEFVKLNITPKVSPTAKLRGKEEISTRLPVKLPVDPVVLDTLRDKLLKLIPVVPELKYFKVWPWWPWRPWWDCTPDIIFRVTQDCEIPGAVIVDENFLDTRWNIPTDLDVTLVANDKACCVVDEVDGPDGVCTVLTNVCDISIDRIGGNPGAAAAPVGYVDPGVPENWGDRPFGGNVRIQGQVGNDVDYYEFELSDDNGATWNDMPSTAVGDIPRKYWIPSTNDIVPVSFLNIIDGRLVFESRQHYETTHNPSDWGVTRWWFTNNYDSLMNWRTQDPFMNGNYQLRVKGWRLVGNQLVPTNPSILSTCDTQNQATLVLRIDNRLVGLSSGHPASTPEHPCGDGTVHTCTMEPDTDFLEVKIIHQDNSETTVGACGNVPVNETDILQVDFYAYDYDGHLYKYTLETTYGENLAKDLLVLSSLPGEDLLTPLNGAPVPAAAQVGPNYLGALSAGAVAPTWHGGAIRLRTLAKNAFPESCCYQLELHAHKRTIVNCNDGFWNHINYSEYSFGVTV